MRRGLALVVLGVGLALPAAAEKPGHVVPSSIAGHFGLEWTKRKPRCAKIDARLQKKLEDAYHCTVPDEPNASASGRAIVATCRAVKGKGEILVFKTADDCKEERLTQEANGD